MVSIASSRKTLLICLLKKPSCAPLKEAERVSRESKIPCISVSAPLLPPLQLCAVCVGCLSFPLSHSGDFIPVVVECLRACVRACVCVVCVCICVK